MKIGKTLPDGAVYTIPQANEIFAKSEDIAGVEDQVRNLNEMIPTPEAADDGKVLTANANGGYDLSSGGGGGGLQNLVDGTADNSIKSAAINGNPGQSSAAFGSTGRSIGGTYALSAGFDNQSIGNYSCVFGRYNANLGEDSLVAGNLNENRGQESLVAGAYCVNRSPNALLFGNNLNLQTNQPDGCAVFGKYNNTPATDAIFIIGSGTGVNNRANILEIKTDGTFKFADGTEITPAEFAALKALLNQ